MSTVVLYNYLPEILQLTEKTWGFAVSDLRMFSFLFLSLGSLVFMLTITGIVDNSKSAIFLKLGVALGGFLLFLASTFTLLVFVIPGLSQVLGILGAVLFLASFLIIGGTLITTTHSVYDAAC